MNRPSDSDQKSGFFTKYGKDLVVILALILIVYVLVELSVRISIFGADALSYTKMSSIRSTGGSGNLKPSEIEGLVYELKPGLDTVFKLVPFKTNSHGLRDKEYSSEKADGVFRVAVIGGSFTMGAGVPIEETFHSILEQRLSSESEKVDYEFLNFGVAGYTVKDKLSVLENKILQYDADLVLFVLDGSQFAEDKVRSFTPRVDNFSFFKSYSYKLLKKVRFFSDQDKKADDFIQMHMNNFSVLDEALVKISAFSKENAVPVCVVVLDHDYQHEGLAVMIGQKVSAYEGLCFSNTLPYFQNTSFRDYTIYRVDMHPNTQANRIFSEAVYGDLKNQSVLNEARPESQ